ncbi:MAG TPA: tetraacyldisaccharide 4'-kinase [Solimonas sp.]|nr:tetraacyldisaccharide 4'-kinase [Solimonas sp.]
MSSWLERRWYSAEPPPAWLLPLSRLFGRIAAARRARLAPAARSAPLGVPVIVVGNISLGGTGKTPFTLWLIEQLRAEGWSPGVISRGYGGRAPRYPHRVSASDAASVCGDEPLLLARRAGVPVMVDPDRRRGAAALLADGGVDILVADDGLQHYRLPRDLEICVVDGRRGLGNGALLPAGPLREPVSRLGEVDLLVVNGGDWQPPASLKVPQLHMQLAVREAWPLAIGGPPVPLERWRGRPVHAVAGIGHPQRFFDSLAALGLEVIPHPFADHHAFAAADLQFGDELPVLMTEKDAVKCATFAPPQAWQVPATVSVDPAATAAMRQSLQTLRHPPR